MTQREQLDRDARVYVAGRRGMVGSAVWRCLAAQGFTDLVGATSSEVDLREAGAVQDFLDDARPRVVVLAAARVGGIAANASAPADFLADNLRIQLNVMQSALRVGVDRLLFLGSSCIYPRLAPQPINEAALLTGPLEETNDGYAIAKIAGVLQVQALRRQYGVRYISAMPTNLYGPNDNFDPIASHVLPAMIRRFHEAKVTGAQSVTLWGSGTPRREFLHVDDLAEALVFLLDHYDSPEPINVGTGRDLTIRALAELVAEVVGWSGELVQDTSRPDGTPRKLLDVGRLTALGWTARIGLREGIESTYAWYRDREASEQPASRAG